MSHIHLIILLVSGVLCVPMSMSAGSPTTQPALAAKPNELSPDEKAAGFKFLFDGHSTDAWKAWNDDGFPKKGWVVEDGCLKCEATNGRPNGGGGDLVTRQEFVDLDLRWEWKMSETGNSGVKYLLCHDGNGGTPLFQGDDGKNIYGHEYQMLDDDKHPDAKRGPSHMTAALYDLLPPDENRKVRPIGQFNESRIVIRGNHIEHWLNGMRVVEYELGGDIYSTALQKSKYKRVPGFGKKAKSAILLQDHGTAVWFRNLRVRDLSDVGK